MNGSRLRAVAISAEICRRQRECEAMLLTSGGKIRIAVDIGGTFTDIVLMSDDGVLHESKVSTTPADPSIAVIDGVRALLQELSIAPEAVAEILHGTTLASHTIVQPSGAPTGLITTPGFRSVLEVS